MTDNKLAKMPLVNWGGLSFKCRCGNLHNLSVKEIVVKPDACDHIAHFAKKMGRAMHLVFEKKVYEQSHQKVVKKFGKTFDVTTSILDDVNMLDASYCDEILSQAKEQTKVIVCVGGDNACQYGKYASNKLDVQWVFVNLLPDGDDFATDYACLWQNGSKNILPGKAPDVILCDLDLAYQFCLDGVSHAFAIILKNALLVFDRVFAGKVQGSEICDSANHVMISAVKDAIMLAKKPFSKNTVSEIFACQYRISVAKCLSKANKDNFAGVHAFTWALQSKYPEYSVGELSCVVADVLEKIYSQIVDENCLLTIDKDRYLHANLVKKHFGFDVEPSYGWNSDDKAFEQNRDLFRQNLQMAKKINNLCKAMAKQTPLWDEKIANVCLALCTDVYCFDGLLSFANDKGLFDALIN